MSLLYSDPPTQVYRIGDVLMWDTEATDEPDEVFDIAVSFKSILAIFAMQNGKGLTDREKQVCLLRMFYLDNVPEDWQAAYALAVEFMACGKGTVNKNHQEPIYYSWTQDGDYIYEAINKSFDGILEKEPNYHWWRFVNKFMNIDEDCRINKIIANRAAHMKNKADKYQKKARELWPEIYVLAESEPKINQESKDVFDRMSSMWGKR